MPELLKAIHNNLTEVNVKGQDVFRMAGAIQLLEQAIAIAEQNAAEKNEGEEQEGEPNE